MKGSDVQGKDITSITVIVPTHSNEKRAMLADKRNNHVSPSTLRNDMLDDQLKNDLWRDTIRQVDSGSDSDQPSVKEEIQEKSKLRKVRDKVGSFVNSNPVQFIVLTLIIVNAIMMGIGTFDMVTENPDLDGSFEDVDTAFLIIFTVEAILQVFHEGLGTFKNPWLMFDVVIVSFSWVLSEGQVIRGIRVFRALRLVTRLKGMRDLVEALANTLPRMVGITALLSLIIYIFSVMFTEFFRDLYPNQIREPYFARLDGSLLTSFQIMTFDNWAEIVREVMKYKPWAWVPFVTFLLVTGFMVIHLVIAVICDAIADLNDEDKKKLTGNIFKEIFGDDAIDGDAESDCCSKTDQQNTITTDILALQDQVNQLEKQVLELNSSNERTLIWLQQLTPNIEELDEGNISIKDVGSF